MAATEREVGGFSSPFEVPVPEGCEGWESMFPYYALFSEERRASEEARGWFRDGMHFPEPMFPFDFVTADSPYLCLGQANSRIFVVPPALGIDHRVLYGWVYMSANSVTDEAEIGRRAELFMPRAGHYFQNWDELYGRWQAKVEEAIRDLESLEVPDLPEIEDEAVVTEGRGIGSSHTLLVAYNRLLESVDRIWQYHFEFLNLGYAAYLVFYELCKQQFPDIADQAIAKMVSGIDVVLFRPDDELQAPGRARGRARRRRRGAVGAASETRSSRRSPAPATRARAWLADWEAAKEPWFNYSNGNGFYHHHRSWIDDLDRSRSRRLRDYVERLAGGRGHRRGRSTQVARRARPHHRRSTARCSPTTRRGRRSTRTSGLARTVFPYVESHNFYVEHWDHSVFWNKVREFGALLARNGFLDDAGRHLLPPAARGAQTRSSTYGSRGPPARRRAARGYWPPIVARRKRDHRGAARRWTPPPALGAVPGGDHRAVDDHALGHHDRAGAASGSPGRRPRRDAHRLRRRRPAPPRAPPG